MSVLVLDQGYQPIKVVAWQRAVVLVLDNKAEVLEADDEDPVRSASLAIPRPQVIRLRYGVKIPYRARSP